jgi:hypothetical protein
MLEMSDDYFIEEPHSFDPIAFSRRNFALGNLRVIWQKPASMVGDNTKDRKVIFTKLNALSRPGNYRSIFFFN